MKNVISFILFSFSFIAFTSAQFSENRTVPAFDKIVFEGFGELHLIQADSFSVEIDVKKHHHLSELTTVVKGSTLHIYHEDTCDRGWFQNATNFPRTDVYVSYQNLEELDLAGKIKVFSRDAIRSDNFELSTSGHVTGDLEVYTKTLEVESEGYIKMNMSGEAQTLEADFGGLGKFSALELFTDVCEIDVEGTTTVEVYAREYLDADMTGVSTLYYEGKPTKTKIDKSGLVRVRSCRL